MDIKCLQALAQGLSSREEAITQLERALPGGLVVVSKDGEIDEGLTREFHGRYASQPVWTLPRTFRGNLVKPVREALAPLPVRRLKCPLTGIAIDEDGCPPWQGAPDLEQRLMFASWLKDSKWAWMVQHVVGFVADMKHAELPPSYSAPWIVFQSELESRRAELDAAIVVKVPKPKNPEPDTYTPSPFGTYTGKEIRRAMSQLGVSDMRICATDSGVRVERIDWNGPADTVAYRLDEELSRQGRALKLAFWEEVMRRYPYNPTYAAIWGAL